MNKFVTIRIRREVAEEMMNHFIDLNNLFASDAETKKYNRNIINTIKKLLK